jgi:hypothetical protein
MRASSTLILSLALALPLACTAGDDGDTGASSTSAGATTTTSSTTSATTSVETTTSDDSTTTDPGTTTDPSTTDPGTTDPGTTTAPACDPPVVGGYNDCSPEIGKIDNKLCMWMGSGQSVGFVSCLSSAEITDAVTCTIIGCEDDCDCFDPPATGTAVSTCRAMATSKGENACLLDCSAGKTCPDGMVCSNDTCFWAP